MSDISFKEALSNLDPKTRTCILYLERQIKEISVKPLKALSDIENDVINALNEIKENNEKWAEITNDLVDIDKKLTTEYWEALKNNTEKEVTDSVTKIFDDYVDLLNEKKRIFDRRIKRLDESYEKFEKLFAGKHYFSEAGMKKEKIR